MTSHILQESVEVDGVILGSFGEEVQEIRGGLGQEGGAEEGGEESSGK